MSSRKARLPHNREGRIAPYSKDGGNRQQRQNQKAAMQTVGQAGGLAARPSRNSAPTMDQIQADRLTNLANKYWAPQTKKQHAEFDSQVVKDIYQKDLRGADFATKRIMMLEFSQYLEKLLWPHFGDDSSVEHVMSIVLMVNEKFRERVPAWTSFLLCPEKFPTFFWRVLKLSLEAKYNAKSHINAETMEDDGNSENRTAQERGQVLSLREQTFLLVFLDHCFTSMEVDIIREQVQKLVSLSMWESLLPTRRERELKKVPKWKKYWKAIAKKDARETNEETKSTNRFHRRYLRDLMEAFLSVLGMVDERSCPEDVVDYCNHFLMLVLDLEALLPTRRFLDTVLDDVHLVVRSQLSTLSKRPEGHLFSQLLDQLKFYARFEISNETGEQMTVKQTTQVHYDRMVALQKAVFHKYPTLRDFALATVSSIDESSALTKKLASLPKKTLYEIAEFLCLVPPLTEVNLDSYDKAFLIGILVYRHERRDSQLQELNEMPLYPTEDVIWDENVVPGEYYNGEGVLALSKLNLQFLTLQDYLYRNFKLFQLESTYEIRGDIEDIVMRLKPWRPEDGQVLFNGWARMAQPITSFSIVEVAKPNIGEKQPSRVRADVTVNLSLKESVKEEWEKLRKHDVCFLLTVRPPISSAPAGYDYSDDFTKAVGLVSVRGCEVEGMLDENGRVIEEGPEPVPKMQGETRVFRVLLDCNQYHQDMERTAAGGDDVYESFNVLMRRKPKENNFKAVLETIRELMNSEWVVPEFLHDILLGYGDPAAAHYRNMDVPRDDLNFNDTFLDFDHLRSSFPNCDVVVDKDIRKEALVPPFKLTFVDGDEEKKASVSVKPFKVPSRGPYPALSVPKTNQVPFTPTQVEAVRSGMSPGLTMIVGPPGTGKTDVAVQIISNIYHSFPEQRTIIVTHSNQALNQLFEKIMALDIDERHLLRLGHGEESLETEKDFSRYGRVNYVLAKRIELLEEVKRLQTTLGVYGDVAYTCETAGHFFLYEIKSRWEEYQSKLVGDVTTEEIVEKFPFKKFFSNVPEGSPFKGDSVDEHLEVAESCWRYVQDIFAQLEEFRAFELLRSGLDRTRYLVVKEAKIVAMTCTHAALKRKELARMGFKFDNILMEESAQILEIETFIPLLLQNSEDNYNRLKRWIMIGDHHQLPPVVKNMAFQKFSNMEQSLFSRFVRLGVPTVDLDAQGRARPSIAGLYNWHYRNLGNLPHVINDESFLQANGGFSYEYQLVNVPDFNGIGESQPSPYFYQNLAEAEYVVAVFMYMRLLGYPAKKISILTTYNGQKHLIRDVVRARCGNNPMMGLPNKITTVDKFQGQQNDYILLSLVRTFNVGHLRDVRRLIVAMSRARLGLYVFARVALFKNCFELQPSFNILLQRPLQLHLCTNEVYGSKRQVNVSAPNPLIIQDMQHMCKFVYEFYAEKVATMQRQLPPVSTEPLKETTKPEGKVEHHPGAGGDSDNEEDEKSVKKGDKKQEMVEIVNEVK